MINVEFAHKPGDSVRLKSLNLLGTVISCLISAEGKQYQIVWYWDGTRRCEWLHGFEVLDPEGERP
jgi:hypothetical protein